MAVIDPNDPNLGAGNGQDMNPTGPSGWTVLLSYNLVLTHDCLVDVIAGFKQGFASGNKSWACQLTINGDVVDDCWGGAALDRMTLLGGERLPAGSHKLQLLWAAQDSTVSVYRPRMKISWSYK